MRRILALLFIAAISITSAQIPKVKPGIEKLKDMNFGPLKGKRVGLITNPTGVDLNMKSIIDILFEAKEVNLVALYSPEHGIRGEYSAGDDIHFYVDGYTNLPVHSLHGNTKKPLPEMLKDIDVLVYDIQDNGCRSYTYISTMGLAMEAAAENNVEFMVLDRPNPLSGTRIEGNITEDNFISFISQFKIPYLYGLTCGELATMLNEEKMLKDGIKCKLTVIPMEGWNRDMYYEDTGLQWLPASPHVPHIASTIYYVATGVLGELKFISEGVGYTMPFHILGAEWIHAKELADAMNALNIEGVMFRPITFIPYYGNFIKKKLHGIQIHFTDYKKVNLMSIQFLFMQVHNELHPDKKIFDLCDQARHSMFDKACGTDNIRKLFSQNYRYDDIKEYLNKGIEEYRKVSSKYHLYK